MDEKRARFEAQVLPHLDAAYRFATWLSPAPGDADDVVQEAALRAFRAFDSLRGSDVKAWLMAIVRNCHSTALKQRQRRAFVPLPEESDVQDAHAMTATTPDPEDDSIRRDEQRMFDRLHGCAFGFCSLAVTQLPHHAVKQHGCIHWLDQNVVYTGLLCAV